MRSRILIGALSFMVSLSVVSLVAGGVPQSAKWALVNLSQPTMIAGVLVVGPVMFLHDDARMARGEPCTSVHRFWPTGLAEEIVAFHCKPRWGQAPKVFTKAIAQSVPGAQVLTEYQFAGDSEAHGVPSK